MQLLEKSPRPRQKTRALLVPTNVSLIANGVDLVYAKDRLAESVEFYRVELARDSNDRSVVLGIEFDIAAE